MVDYKNTWSFEELAAEFNIVKRELQRIDGKEFIEHVKNWDIYRLSEMLVSPVEPCFAAAA